ncbi:radical SAM domain protein [Desulfocucumis palustris]|uniref:Radical SAM domain protein n=1 Tax=Desulfocucumis palustris TaxID=1898651 RepID=A0A2L2XFG6_9FIRM|nr:radical SAM protein [Desulfocucumis palustris]GBF34433.1 radical SAM domain protein [Desulfocucumis palustris]
METRYLFGPVPSRRLGVSLGVDLVPFKTCSLDCVYCECGKTTHLTISRKEYVPVNEVLKELDEYLRKDPQLDYITFSGSGEPTLYSEIGQVINYIKDNFPRYKVAVLTNGTLLSCSEVSDRLKRADMVIPSLDAASENTFKKINRPHSSIKCSDVISGIARFRHQYQGDIRLEVFIVPGLNDTEVELRQLREAIQEIRPGCIQLNSLDRPGTENWVKPADSLEMRKIAAYLGDAEIVGHFKPRQKIAAFSKDKEQSILLTLKRRPCTAEDLEHILNLHMAEIQKYLQALLESGQIENEQLGRGVFFKIKK